MVLVSQVKRHVGECPAAPKQGRTAASCHKVKAAKECREKLSKLVSDKLRSALPPTAYAGDGLSRNPKRLRKRGRQLEADAPQRKQGRLTRGDVDMVTVPYESLQANSAIGTSSSQLLPLRRFLGLMLILSPDNYGSSNTWQSLPGLLTDHPELAISNGGPPFQLRERDLGLGGGGDVEALFRSENSEAAYAAFSDSIVHHGVALTQTPLLSSATSLSRAPTLSVHTVDGPALSAAYATLQSTTPVRRAPTLSVYTVDGTAHQSVGGYFSTHVETSAATMADHIIYNHVS